MVTTLPQTSFVDPIREMNAGKPTDVPLIDYKAIDSPAPFAPHTHKNACGTATHHTLPHLRFHTPLASIHAGHIAIPASHLLLHTCRVVGCPWAWATSSTAVGNVVHGRVQRCPRPWTTIDPAVCYEDKRG